MSSTRHVIFRGLICAVIMAALLGLSFFFQDKARDPGDVVLSARSAPRERLIELGTTVLLGSFRTILIDGLWYRSDKLKERREWVELEGQYRLIAKLQPAEIGAYVHQVWNMAYNVQYDAPTIVEGWKWIQKAVKFGKDGIERNPNHPEVWSLYREIGWVFAHRCASVGDKRAQFFGEQVEKEYGKHPYLVAADWYEQAWKAAIRPGVRNVNVQWISMWAYAYSNLARLMEEQGDFEKTLLYRRKAIDIHKTIISQFPDYREPGEQAIAELRTLNDLHLKARAADILEREKKTADELVLSLEVADGWASRFANNPNSPENRRNLEHAIDQLESIAGRLGDLQKKLTITDKVLNLRFLAAQPSRDSAAAAERLELAVAPYDQKLERLGPNELALNLPLVRFDAQVWARIVANFPNDNARAAKAQSAVLRLDRLFEQLHSQMPAAQRNEVYVELINSWLTLLTHSDLDLPMGRRRIAETAAIGEQALLARVKQVTAGLREMERAQKANEPVAQLQTLIAQISQAVAESNFLAQSTVVHWSVFLKKNPAWKDDARNAETHLRTIAEALDEVAETARAVLGPDSSSQPGDPRGLVNHAQSAWRVLHEFDPVNPDYLRRATQPARTVPNVHDLDPGHDDHDH